jgi:hypothetical protein
VLAHRSVDSVYPSFVAAIQDAVRGSKVMPLVNIVRGGEETTIVVLQITTTYPERATALSFHEDYELTFAQRDGRGVASMSEAVQPAQPA